jgi:hypothetical protein
MHAEAVAAAQKGVFTMARKKPAKSERSDTGKRRNEERNPAEGNRRGEEIDEIPEDEDEPRQEFESEVEEERR